MRLLFAPLAAALLASAAPAVTVAPVGVTASNTFSFFGEYKPSNLIDGSGLDAAGLHGSDYATMWMTDLGVQQATLTFDLGETRTLSGISIWNYNFGTPGFLSTLERGAAGFAVALSSDAVAFTDALAGTLAMADGTPTAAQDFALAGSARYVRLSLLGNHVSDPQAVRDSAVGLSEVRFETVAAAVPEPASWVMTIAGFGMLGLTVRRRRGPALAA